MASASEDRPVRVILKAVTELSPLEKQLVAGHPNNLLCANSFSLQMEAAAASPLQKWCEWGVQAQTLP
jgi:hypothetical protein